MSRKPRAMQVIRLYTKKLLRYTQIAVRQLHISYSFCAEIFPKAFYGERCILREL